MMKMLKIVSVLVLAAGVVSTAEAQVTKGALDQNADQAQGNYAATNLNYLGGGSLGMMQSAWKDPIRHMGEGQSRPGYTKYYWTPELVLPVRIREGMYTLINFPNWEVIENVYLGDGQSFNAEIQGPSSLMVYPETSQFVGVDTNMIVFGRSGNKYVFYVQSETVNTDRITNAIIDIEVVNKKQNANGSAVISSGSGGGHVNAGGYASNSTSADSTFTRNVQREDWIENIPIDPTKFRFDIEVYVPNPDDIIIAPERVWRDNIFTYIDLGEKALTAVQRPIVTLIVERSETPVGFRSAGPNNRLIIVEGMGDMVLRSGKRIVCLKLRRSDSDGLENTIYAKTNEWDLQTGYASAHEKANDANDIFNTDDEIEDVYGENPNQGRTQEFFNESKFINPQIPLGKNGVHEGITTSGTSFNPNEAGNLNALPKAKTIVNPSSSQMDLTGQYNVKAGETEMIVPDYNNQPVDTAITYVADKTEINDKKTSANLPTVQLGNSTNNSSPVLIAAKDNVENKNLKVSKETEALLDEFRSGKAFDNANSDSISIELGTDENINNLERLWNDISKRYSAALGQYQAFYSVDAPADGQGKEVFHLRVGPIKSLQDGDNVCSQLGRNGIFCSVVRIQ